MKLKFTAYQDIQCRYKVLFIIGWPPIERKFLATKYLIVHMADDKYIVVALTVMIFFIFCQKCFHLRIFAFCGAIFVWNGSDYFVFLVQHFKKVTQSYLEHVPHIVQLQLPLNTDNYINAQYYKYE